MARPCLGSRAPHLAFWFRAVAASAPRSCSAAERPFGAVIAAASTSFVALGASDPRSWPCHAGVAVLVARRRRARRRRRTRSLVQPRVDAPASSRAGTSRFRGVVAERARTRCRCEVVGGLLHTQRERARRSQLDRGGAASAAADVSVAARRSRRASTPHGASGLPAAAFFPAQWRGERHGAQRLLADAVLVRSASRRGASRPRHLCGGSKGGVARLRCGAKRSTRPRTAAGGGAVTTRRGDGALVPARLDGAWRGRRRRQPAASRCAAIRASSCERGGGADDVAVAGGRPDEDDELIDEGR